MNSMKKTLIGLCLILGVLFQSPLAAQEEWKFPQMGVEYKYKKQNKPKQDTLKSIYYLEFIDTISKHNTTIYELMKRSYEDSKLESEKWGYMYLFNERIYGSKYPGSSDCLDDFEDHIMFPTVSLMTNDTLVNGWYEEVSFCQGTDSEHSIYENKYYIISDIARIVEDTIFNGMLISKLYIVEVREEEHEADSKVPETRYEFYWISKEYGIVKYFKFDKIDDRTMKPIFELISVRKLED